VSASTGCGHNEPAAPTLGATCSATPNAGTAPLRVSFALNVTGAQGSLSVQINYGDGSTGSDPSAPHTYAAAGTFSASFLASTANQSTTCATSVQATAPPAPSPSPTPVANREPSVSFRTDPVPTAGRTFDSNEPLTIEFNMCQSSDPDGDPLNFRMDLDGDGVFEVDGPTGADCRRTHRYEQSGPASPSVFNPTICATDTLNGARLHPYQCRTWEVKIYR
jgi:hypothetical protein